MLTNTQIDFGYPWWLSYGHVPFLALAAVLLVAGYRRKWSKFPMALVILLTLWAGTAFLIVRFGFNANGRGSLPTESFLTGGKGRVLDIGAGTGRSSIMVLEARPAATLVALDLFGESFDQHFGHGETPQQRLLANLKAAGVAERASIEKGDMRSLPFEAASFDAVVSAYAIDHLNRAGSTKAITEAARVIKPHGDFLLMVIAKEPWAQFAFGPLLAHGGPRGQDWWTAQLQGAGFEVLEKGTRPATLYVLARRM